MFFSHYNSNITIIKIKRSSVKFVDTDSRIVLPGDFIQIIINLFGSQTNFLTLKTLSNKPTIFRQFITFIQL